MKTTRGATILALCMAAAATSQDASAQRRRPPPRGRADAGVAVAPSGNEHRFIAIPVVEASSMFQRQRVWLFTPPAGATAFGINTLGQGDRVWALLPSCRQPNPDDPRDPCPVGRVTIEVITGSGEVQSVGPTDVATTPNSRRVMSFVIPASADVIRMKILKNDGTMRYEAAVHRAQLVNLPAPEGRAQGSSFAFDLTRYPSM
ncbi:MAG: hypothetical protein JNK05_11600 [Myxococcales bacterium]|nr:hypothetical protein [Myxococcales bacterium]